MNRPIPTTAGRSAAVLAFALGLAGTLGTAACSQTSSTGGQTTQAQTAQAPVPEGSAGHHGNRMGQILLSLGLSDAQKAQIKDIMAAARKQNEGVTDRDVRRANFKKAYEQVNTILTPAQQKEFKEKMAAMRQQYQAQQPTH
jgi:Spy/CpxP family protein refolding chaperone